MLGGTNYLSHGLLIGPSRKPNHKTDISYHYFVMDRIWNPRTRTRRYKDQVGPVGSRTATGPKIENFRTHSDPNP